MNTNILHLQGINNGGYLSKRGSRQISTVIMVILKIYLYFGDPLKKVLLLLLSFFIITMLLTQDLLVNVKKNYSRLRRLARNWEEKKWRECINLMHP